MHFKRMILGCLATEWHSQKTLLDSYIPLKMMLSGN